MLRFLTVGAIGLAAFLQSPYRLLALDDPNGRMTLGQALAPFGPTIRFATTEAGHLAYWSGAETVDLWGLNTPAFARAPANGAFLARENFDLIILPIFQHADCAVIRERHKALFAAGPDDRIGTRNWRALSASLQSGIDPTRYRLHRIAFTAKAPPFLAFVNTSSPQKTDIEAALKASGARACS